MRSVATVIKLLLVLNLSVWLYLMTIWPAKPPEPSGQLADPKLKRAMHYHGTLAAWQHSNGRYYFRRNGQRCQLYTKQFEDSFKRVNAGG